MDKIIKEKLWEYLCSYLTENKKTKIEQISANRSNYLTIALEDINEPKDASAVIRTCECFGIQEINIIENQNRYKINPDVTMGSSKWTNINHFKKSEQNNSKICLQNLRVKGYKIVGMVNNEIGTPIEKIPLDKKYAFVFADEGKDLSEYVVDNSDFTARVSTYGFTGSFNLSAYVAVVIHNFTTRLNQSQIGWKLNNEEILDLKIKWVKKVLKSSELLEKKFLESL
jgi:tRNA (guanosine-2'-O-)-methyltransferase